MDVCLPGLGGYPAGGARAHTEAPAGGPDGSAYSMPKTGLQIFATWLKFSSTGVSRPKIETSTLSFCWSALISLIVAGSEAKAPSVTVTESPISKSSTLISGLALDFSVVTAGASHLMTSSRDSGAGRSARSVAPTKPVTPGVLRTQEYDSGVSSIRTRMYPGKTLFCTLSRLPFLTSTSSRVGTSTWKMYSSMSRLVIRVSRFVLTLFSYPAYEWTTYQSPGAKRSDWRSAATGSSSGSAVATAMLGCAGAWADPGSVDSSTSVTSSVLPAISSYSGTSSLPLNYFLAPPKTCSTSQANAASSDATTVNMIATNTTT